MIIRSKRNHSYTCIDNAVFTSGLSLKAIGLISYLLSKPDNWNISVSGCASQLSEGKNLINRILNELVSKGFCEKKRHANGKFDWIMSDNPHPQNVDMGQKPHPQKPDQGFEVQVITESKLLKKEKESGVSRFDEWWAIWLRKTDKATARKKWISKKLDAKADEIIAKTKNLNHLDYSHRDKEYILMPTTFLNGERWEDEPIDRTTPKAQAKKNGKPAWAKIPHVDDDLWNWAKSHGFPNPGNNEDYYQYRRRLQGCVEQRIAQEGMH